VKEKEKENTLKCLKLNNFKRLVTQIELAIQSGFSVLIENIMEEIDA
jgi:hypothetical protein